MYISAKVVAGLAKRNRTIVLDKKPLGDWMDGWMAGRVAGATVCAAAVPRFEASSHHIRLVLNSQSRNTWLSSVYPDSR